MEWFLNNLGTVITVITSLTIGAATVGAVRSEVKYLDKKITSLEQETNQLRDVVIELAKQEGRIHSVEQILISQGHRIDALTLRMDKMIQREYDAER